MVSPVMGAAMIGTMYFLRANCAQYGGSASGGGLISAPLLSYRALVVGRGNVVRFYLSEILLTPPLNRYTIV